MLIELPRVQSAETDVSDQRGRPVVLCGETILLILVLEVSNVIVAHPDSLVILSFEHVARFC